MACTGCGQFPTMCNCPGVPSAPACPGYGPDVTPAPGNTPPPEGYYPCTLTVRLQTTKDRTELINHRMGRRPYEVWLVWQRRDQVSRTWVLEAEMQLMPALIPNFAETLGLDLSYPGLSDAGTIKVERVSPNQVDLATLGGKLRGEDWGNDTADKEFFYEVRLATRCATDEANPRLRFALSGVPFFDVDGLQWLFSLTKQNEARSSVGVDESTPQFSFVQPRGRLIG